MGLFYLWDHTRPFILIVGVVILALCGYVNGFTTSRMLKFFNLSNTMWSDWKTSALVSVFIFPMYILTTLSLGDIVESFEGSSAAVPMSEGLLLYLIWWALDAPFALYGAFRGFQVPLAFEL